MSDVGADAQCVRHPSNQIGEPHKAATEIAKPGAEVDGGGLV
jgi:hypothetical protein